MGCGAGGGPALQYALHMCTSVHDVIQAFATTESGRSVYMSL